MFNVLAWALVVLGGLWLGLVAWSARGGPTYPTKTWSNEDVCLVVFVHVVGYLVVGATLHALVAGGGP